MQGLPRELRIALWAVATLWMVGLMAYFTDADREIVFITFLMGVIAVVTEWRSSS
jgi:hypothetical protein